MVSSMELYKYVHILVFDIRIMCVLSNQIVVLNVFMEIFVYDCRCY